MSVSQNLLIQLKEQINAGFKISEYSLEQGIHYFRLPALEYDNYTIGIPDSIEVQKFLASQEYEDSKMKSKKYCVVLLDIIGFSNYNDDTQLKMIVRYQCEMRRALKNLKYEKLISIGDGTIFIFPESEIPNMANNLYAIDHAISSYNLDFKNISEIEINFRIGVHVGNAYLFYDINKETNYIGNGINIAQRISTFVPDLNDNKLLWEEKSPIYVSENAYEEISSYCNIKEYLFWDAGSKPDKHGNIHHYYAFHKITN